jgi:hypothetical protein
MTARPDEGVVLEEIDPRFRFVEPKPLLDLAWQQHLGDISSGRLGVRDWDDVDEFTRPQVASDNDDRCRPVFPAGSFSAIVFATP